MKDLDRSLVSKAAVGDKVALNQLVEAIYKDVSFFAISRVGPQEGKDVAHEALVRIMDKIQGLRDPDRFKTWAMSIVYNISVDHLRGTQVDNEKLYHIESQEEYNNSFFTENDKEVIPESAILDNEQRERVISVLKEMPQHYSDSIWFFYYEGMSYKEIAEVMGTDETRVKNCLYQGRKMFRQRFEVAVGEGSPLYGLSPLPLLVKSLETEATECAMTGIYQEILRGAQGYLAKTSLVTAQAVHSSSSALKIVGGMLAAAVVIGGVYAFFINGRQPEPVPTAPPAVSMEPTPSPERAAPLTPNPSPREVYIPPVAPQPTPEAPINTLEDMIGDGEAAQLYGYEASGVAEADWGEYLLDIGAAFERQASEYDYIYAVYSLEKQDKQLLLTERIDKQTGEINVTHRFGLIDELPPTIELILDFYS